MREVYNFFAGSATLPKYVMEKAANEMFNYHGSKQSVMETSHRSGLFRDIIDSTAILIRNILNVPNTHKILFLQGGASSQFSMVPLNLMTKNNISDYIITGQWAQKAYLEARRYGNARAIASSEKENFSLIPDVKKIKFSENADYVHICLNNTVYGTKYIVLPEGGEIPLIADASSCIMSEPMDVSKFGLLYASAQKNLGIAGLTLVIVKEDLIKNEKSYTPTMFKHETHLKANSLYNTPPCYAIYICKLMMQWIKKEFGNLEVLNAFNKEKANLIYDFIDQSKLFKGTANRKYRSLMNVMFITGDKNLDAKFIKECSQEGIINVKGYRTVGGMQASIYNAMPIEGVEKLVEFMKKFELQNTWEMHNNF